MNVPDCCAGVSPVRHHDDEACRSTRQHPPPNRLDRPIPRRTPPVKPRAKRGQHLHHVAHQIISHLTGIQHHQPPPVRRQRRLHQFSVHPPQPIPMLYHHRGDQGIGQKPPYLATRAVHPQPRLGLHPHHHRTSLRRPLAKPRHLPIQVITLIMRRHSRIQAHTTVAACHHEAWLGPEGAAVEREQSCPAHHR